MIDRLAFCCGYLDKSAKISKVVEPLIPRLVVSEKTGKDKKDVKADCKASSGKKAIPEKD